MKRCDEVFLEHYTSILGVDVARLEAFYGKKVRLADRELVESGSEAILGSAKEKDVALLVVGDPFGATTHTDMFLRGREQGVEVKVIHNASIMNAVGSCGLQLYNFGQTVSIPLFQGNWKPESFYDKIACNAKDKLHTLCLLDIKVKEPNIEAMEKGKMVYDPPRYMTVKEACEQLMYVEEVRQQGLLSRETRVVGMARIGQDSQSIVAATIGDMLDGAVDMGPPLHSVRSFLRFFRFLFVLTLCGLLFTYSPARHCGRRAPARGRDAATLPVFAGARAQGCRRPAGRGRSPSRSRSPSSSTALTSMWYGTHRVCRASKSTNIVSWRSRRRPWRPRRRWR